MFTALSSTSRNDMPEFTLGPLSESLSALPLSPAVGGYRPNIHLSPTAPIRYGTGTRAATSQMAGHGEGHCK